MKKLGEVSLLLLPRHHLHSHLEHGQHRWECLRSHRTGTFLVMLQSATYTALTSWWDLQHDCRSANAPLVSASLAGTGHHRGEVPNKDRPKVSFGKVSLVLTSSRKTFKGGVHDLNKPRVMIFAFPTAFLGCSENLKLQVLLLGQKEITAEIPKKFQH